MSKTVIIRADASSVIGTGHVMRCLALAQEMLKQGYFPLFVCNRLDGTSGKILSQYGIPFEEIENSADELEDARETSRMASDKKARLIIVDHYGLKEPFRHFMKKENLQLMIIDDLGESDHITADIVLNQNMGAASLEQRYQKIAPEALLLLGEKYVMFRKDIIENGLKARRNRKERIEKLMRGEIKPNILVSFGGSDILGLTSKTASMFREISPELYNKVSIVLGVSAPEEMKSEVEQEIADLPGVKLHINPVFSELLKETDIALTAGGSTVHELAFFGIVPIIIKVAENQDIICRGFEKKGGASVIYDPGNLNKIKRVVLDLMESPVKINELSSKNIKNVDEKGVERILKQIKSNQF